MHTYGQSRGTFQQKSSGKKKPMSGPRFTRNGCLAYLATRRGEAGANPQIGMDQNLQNYQIFR